MNLPEGFTPPQSETKKVEKETAPKSPDAVIETEISNEQIERYATDAEEYIEQQATEILPETEQKIESFFKSMNVSPETMHTARQEQGGLDEQLSGIQSEANKFADEAKLDIKTINAPQFIKQFSKQESPEERTRLAREIREKRSENFAANKELGEKNGELQKKIADIKELEELIADLSGTGLSRLMNYFKLRNLQAQLSGERNDYIDSQKDKIILPDMMEPKKMLDNFYAGEKKKWENSPYSKEDIEINFSEEHLSSLSLEDYALLMKRFPNQMVAHVTRQGVRDHTGMLWHTKGEGEFHNGFVKMMEDGRLRSPLGIALVEKEKEKAMEIFLHLDKFSSKDEALENLEKYTREDQGNHYEGVGEYVDSMSIHFATEQVADRLYGGEKGNEFFFAIPSAQIASQYYFNGQLRDSSGGQRNDQWVWANEEKGININSGLVFIPEKIQVSKENGSKYELDENKNRKVYQENIEDLKRLMKYDDLNDLVKSLQRTAGETGKNLSELNIELREKCGIQNEKLANYMISNPKLMSNLENLSNAYYFVDDDEVERLNQKVDERLKNILDEGDILYEMAKDATPAKDYWENYFNNHPEQRPSKIVYYNGDPTTALENWQIKNGLKKRSDREDLGFEERSVSRDSSHATAGMGRFKAIAEKVIDDYYQK